MIDEPIWRTLSTGRCFVYALACREHDMLKIGYARDPWARMRRFHPRFHAFFDLDRSVLIETERVKEARLIEKTLKAQFESATEIAPLAIRERAGGKFEWFRGIHPAVIAAMHTTSADLGHPLHAPLSDWLRDQWLPQLERIVDWSGREYEQIEAWHFNADPALVAPRQRTLRNLLEAWESIGIALDEHLGDPVSHWFRNGFNQ